MPCSRLLAQLPTPTMPTAICLMRVARAGGRERPRSERPHILNGSRAVNAAAAQPANLLLSEPRREVGAEHLIGVKATRLGEQLLLGLGVVRVRHAAVDGTDGGAMLLIGEAA